MMTDTQLIRDARFGRHNVSEMTHAHELLASVPDDSLTVFDRGFFSAQLLSNLATSGNHRHFLIPAKTNTKWTIVDGTDEDALVEMTISAQARKADPDFPKTWRARAVKVDDGAGGKPRHLLTSPTDRKTFKRADLAACYQRRWRMETGYRELKQQSMLGHALKSGPGGPARFRGRRSTRWLMTWRASGTRRS